MRIRGTSGDVVPYAGQSPGAAVGAVTLEIPSAGTNVNLGGGDWLAAPGGAPNGYLRYADDAFAVDFTLPDALDVDAATPAVLFLNPTDLAQMALDADPASAVDWGEGHWLGYENSLGAEGDTGGGDCSFRPFVAPAAGAAAPAPPPDRGGGGDGTGLLMMLVGLLLLLSRRSPRGETGSRLRFRTR
jgi:hypothetical protein